MEKSYGGVKNGMLYSENAKIINMQITMSVTDITLQEMCCGFLLSREMWYRKSVLPGTGAG